MGYTLIALLSTYDYVAAAASFEYAYIAGDISKAYATAKAKQVTRSMVTLRTADFMRPGGVSGKILVCDLKPGSYAITRDGALAAYASASTEGGCAYFSGGAGSYVLASGAPTDGGPGPDATSRDGAAVGDGPRGDGLRTDSRDSGVGDDGGCGCDASRDAARGGALPLLLLIVLLLGRRRATEPGAL